MNLLRIHRRRRQPRVFTRVTSEWTKLSHEKWRFEEGWIFCRKNDLQGSTTCPKLSGAVHGETFKKYSGEISPESLAPDRFMVVQANLLGALKRDLAVLKWPTKVS
jgi:hypothetical protein